MIELTYVVYFKARLKACRGQRTWGRPEFMNDRICMICRRRPKNSTNRHCNAVLCIQDRKGLG